ncbi:MAG: nucleotidyltransferase family protein, partial [Halioglobus sp.]|nr:nucleotidyltransferase family protein [Halioglobus sp.]
GWRGAQDIDVIDAASFRLLPLIYLRLKTLDPGDPLLPRLQVVYRHCWFKNQMLFNQARGLLDTLEQAGVACMLLKGAAMTPRYYPDAGQRFMHDIDVLVPARQFDSAVACLVDARWQLQGSSPARLRLLRRWRFLHGASFRRDNAELDLHGQLSRFVWQDEALLWGSARSQQWQGREVRIPSATFMLYHCCVHGLRWSYAILSWIPDALRMLADQDDPVDWPLLLRLGEQTRSVCQLYHALAYLAATWSAAVPPAVLDALRSMETSPTERAEYAQLARRPRRNPGALAKRLWLRSCRYRQGGKPASRPIGPSPVGWLAYLALYSLAPGNSRD